MVERAAADLAGAARHSVHGAGVGGRGQRFGVGARAVDATAAAVDDVGTDQGAGQAVLAVDELGSFVGVAVAAQHEVDAAGFEDRQRVLAHLHQFDLSV